MLDTTNHDDNDITERLIDGGMRAIADDLALLATTVQERRAIVQAVTVSVLRTLADEIEAADEDDVLWPDADDLRILAGEIEDAAVQP
jgi:hypothetical protein